MVLIKFQLFVETVSTNKMHMWYLEENSGMHGRGENVDLLV